MIRAALLAMALSLGGAASAKPAADPVQTLRDHGIAATRQVASDLCLPSTAEEYQAMGRNGVIRLEASTLLPAELPLQRVYLFVNGLRVPLHSLAQFDKREDAPSRNSGGETYWRQVSFYLAPLNLIKAGAQVMVDFSGQRADFGVTTYKLGQNAPAFVRLDDYDTPSEPDADAIVALLGREYPADFPPKPTPGA